VSLSLLLEAHGVRDRMHAVSSTDLWLSRRLLGWSKQA